MKSFDFKKAYSDLYRPGQKPGMIEVPRMKFLTVAGEGDPNQSAEYKAAIEMIYSLSYTIKMWKLDMPKPEGFFDYTVLPLEGLWYGAGITADGLRVKEKRDLCWLCMIRQPDFVTEEILEKAKEAFGRKKPELETQKVSLRTWKEGLCVQMMHLGSYDGENQTIAEMRAFCEKNGFQEDFSAERMHHEIYLSNPRKCAPEKLKTIIRHPIRKKG